MRAASIAMGQAGPATPESALPPSPATLVRFRWQPRDLALI